MKLSSIPLSAEMSADHLVEIAYELQKQLRAKEAAAGKEKAVYEQRIELLEIRVKEAQERGENMKKMYEAMLSALKPLAGDTSQPAKEILLINELHKKDLADIKRQHSEIVASLSRQIEDLKGSLALYESDSRRELMRQGDAELNYKGKLLDGKMKQKELEARIGKMEAERLRINEDVIVNTKEMFGSKELERVKEEHRKELERIKDQYNNVFQEIKQIYQQERQMSEVKLERASNLIRTLQDQREFGSGDLHEMYLEEIKEFDREFEECKRNRLEEFIESKSEQYIGEKCNNRYGNSSNEIVDTSSYNSAQQFALKEENEKLKVQVASLEAHVTKLEERTQAQSKTEAGLLAIQATPEELSYSGAAANFHEAEDIDLHSYERYCSEDKPQLAKRLCIADKALKEIMERFGATEEELSRTREKCAALEEEQVKNEASLKTEVKSLISQVSSTKMKLFQSAEKLCRDENALRELRGIFENIAISQECYIRNAQRNSENLYVNETPKELNNGVARSIPSAARSRTNDCSVLKESGSKVINSTNNIFSMMESMSSRGNDRPATKTN